MSEGLDVGALCRRYAPMVLRRCRHLLRDDAEARDACQDVFLKLLERRTRLDGSYPSSLLFRMATNICLNRIRDRGRRPEGHQVTTVQSEDGDGSGGGNDDLLHRLARVETPGGASEARLTLDRLFSRHPASSRTMAVLHYVDGMTLEEVSDVTGLSVSGVRKRLRHLRAALHDLDRGGRDGTGLVRRMGRED